MSIEIEALPLKAKPQAAESVRQATGVPAPLGAMVTCDGKNGSSSECSRRATGESSLLRNYVHSE